MNYMLGGCMVCSRLADSVYQLIERFVSCGLLRWKDSSNLHHLTNPPIDILMINLGEKN